jgi:beta-lactam-binding protein with PASTA domain
VKTNLAGNPVAWLIQRAYEWVVSMTQPSVVRVPDVGGHYTGTARHQLRMLGLRVKAVHPDGGMGRRVRSQDPAPGSDAKRGTVVSLYLVPESGVEYT